MNHILLNIGPVSALWAPSAMSKLHLRAGERAKLVRYKENAGRPVQAAEEARAEGISEGTFSWPLPSAALVRPRLRHLPSAALVRAHSQTAVHKHSVKIRPVVVVVSNKQKTEISG